MVRESRRIARKGQDALVRSADNPAIADVHRRSTLPKLQTRGAGTGRDAICAEPGDQPDGIPHRRPTASAQQATCRPDAGRSEEHTSELQSLMRISYAVFCLKKKNTITQLKTTTREYHADF